MSTQPSNNSTILLDSHINAITKSPDLQSFCCTGRSIFKIVQWSENGWKEKVNLRPRTANMNYSGVDVQWNPVENNLVATSSTTGAVILWNVLELNSTKRKLLHALKQHTRTTNRVDWHSVQPNLLLSGSEDGTCRIWDLNRLPKSTITIECKSEVKDAQFSTHSPQFHLVAALENGDVQIWDMRNTSIPHTLIQGAHRGHVLATKWNPINKNFIATGGRDGILKVWNINHVTEPVSTINTPGGGVKRLLWHPDHANTIAQVATIVDSHVHFWDIRKPFVPLGSLITHTDLCTDVSWHDPSHRYLVSCGKDGRVIRHDLNLDLDIPAQRVSASSISWTPTDRIASVYEPYSRQNLLAVRDNMQRHTAVTPKVTKDSTMMSNLLKSHHTEVSKARTPGNRPGRSVDNGPVPQDKDAAIFDGDGIDSIDTASDLPDSPVLTSTELAGSLPRVHDAERTRHTEAEIKKSMERAVFVSEYPQETSEALSLPKAAPLESVTLVMSSANAQTHNRFVTKAPSNTTHNLQLSTSVEQVGTRIQNEVNAASSAPAQLLSKTLPGFHTPLFPAPGKALVSNLMPCLANSNGSNHTTRLWVPPVSPALESLVNVTNRALMEMGQVCFGIGSEKLASTFFSGLAPLPGSPKKKTSSASMLDGILPAGIIPNNTNNNDQNHVNSQEERGRTPIEDRFSKKRKKKGTRARSLSPLGRMDDWFGIDDDDGAIFSAVAKKTSTASRHGDYFPSDKPDTSAKSKTYLQKHTTNTDNHDRERHIFGEKNINDSDDHEMERQYIRSIANHMGLVPEIYEERGKITPRKVANDKSPQHIRDNSEGRKLTVEGPKHQHRYSTTEQSRIFRDEPSSGDTSDSDSGRVPRSSSLSVPKKMSRQASLPFIPPRSPPPSPPFERLDQLGHGQLSDSDEDGETDSKHKQATAASVFGLNEGFGATPSVINFLANAYQIRGAPIGVLCEHNSRQASRVNQYKPARLWQFIKDTCGNAREDLEFRKSHSSSLTNGFDNGGIGSRVSLRAEKMIAELLEGVNKITCPPTDDPTKSINQPAELVPQVPAAASAVSNCPSLAPPPSLAISVPGKSQNVDTPLSTPEDSSSSHPDLGVSGSFSIDSSVASSFGSISSPRSPLFDVVGNGKRGHVGIEDIDSNNNQSDRLKLHGFEQEFLASFLTGLSKPLQQALEDLAKDISSNKIDLQPPKRSEFMGKPDVEETTKQIPPAWDNNWTIIFSTLNQHIQEGDLQTPVTVYLVLKEHFKYQQERWARESVLQEKLFQKKKALSCLPAPTAIAEAQPSQYACTPENGASETADSDIPAPTSSETLNPNVSTATQPTVKSQPPVHVPLPRPLADYPSEKAPSSQEILCWVHQYVELLHRLELHTEAAGIVKYCPLPQIRQRSHHRTAVNLKCSACNSLLNEAPGWLCAKCVQSIKSKPKSNELEQGCKQTAPGQQAESNLTTPAPACAPGSIGQPESKSTGADMAAAMVTTPSTNSSTTTVTNTTTTAMSTAQTITATTTTTTAMTMSQTNTTRTSTTATSENPAAPDSLTNLPAVPSASESTTSVTPHTLTAFSTPAKSSTISPVKPSPSLTNPSIRRPIHQFYQQRRMAKQQQHSKPAPFVPLQPHQERTKTCAICRQTVKGIYVWCQGCGHGGHPEHFQEWFKASNHCPSGCRHLCKVSAIERNNPLPTFSYDEYVRDEQMTSNTEAGDGYQEETSRDTGDSSSTAHLI